MVGIFFIIVPSLVIPEDRSKIFYVRSNSTLLLALAFSNFSSSSLEKLFSLLIGLEVSMATLRSLRSYSSESSTG
jgi:hypothetical protein